ncbi:MAG: hypothetical protein CMG34_01455 [Candidatus Marinimicrobia bacterium]|nr:hypothetical protein [Candidatus Neomarinimicrobiota bacterium]
MQTTIGEPIKFSLYVNHPDSNLIQFPLWNFDNSIELRSLLTKLKNNSTIAELEIVFWDTGSIAIPELNLNILNKDSLLLYSMASEEIVIDILSIKEKNPDLIDISNDILPIKEPVPVNLKRSFTRLLQFILLLFILLSIILLWKKRLKTSKIEDLQPFKTENSISIAKKKLEDLKSSDLAKKSHKKDFYIKLSFIIREYIENSFFIRTLEMTTDELEQNRSIFPFDERLINNLIKILSMSDLVKYAKYDNSRDKCLLELEDAIDFVDKSSSYLFKIEEFQKIIKKEN